MEDGAVSFVASITWVISRPSHAFISTGHVDLGEVKIQGSPVSRHTFQIFVKDILGKIKIRDGEKFESYQFHQAKTTRQVGAPLKYHFSMKKQ